MKIDLTKNSIENTLALVNFANPGIDLPSQKVMFDTISAETSNNGAHNTKVRLSAQEGKGLEGQVFVTYYRPGLLEQTDLPSVTYSAEYTVTPDALRARICAALELLAIEVTWRSLIIGAVGDTTTCVLAAKDDSLLYQGIANLQITWTEA